MKIINSVRFIGLQGLAFRGHTSSHGNFSQLITLRCEDSSELATWIDKRYKDFTSWKIQNEVLELFVHDIIRSLCVKVQAAAAGLFAVVVD